VGLGLVAGGVAVAEGLAVRDGPADGDGDGDGELLGRLVGDGELLGRLVGDGVAAGRVCAGLGVLRWACAAVRPAGADAGKGRTKK
jgi:hypothetical protein